MKLLPIILIVLLVGCGTKQVIPVKPIYVDSAITKPCETLEDTPVFTAEDISKENITLYGKYAICARKQDDSAKLINKLTNTKE